ncbi:hypothetical protein [Liquorilactobacillus hordei]|uniref:Uncharacterized protein n=1 Tax=Liquorilactobacillus hordei TaxID=468911 RepID=A0A3S6QNP3_9LACO|nr:hypothetical protein [Liquorilactobacillus hordei]AUJ29614.1 hypothetical protein BSQ49_05010 [Liquorilactobacillus hordei]
MHLSKLLKYGSHTTWRTKSASTTLVLLVIVIFLNIFFGIDFLSNFAIITLFSGSISGMTFTLTLLTAIISILDDDEMKQLYEYTQKNIEKIDDDDRFVFYETFAPYAWIALLFCISSILSLFGGVFNFEIFKKIRLYYIVVWFKYIDIAAMALAIWSLFDLVIDTIISKMDKIIRKSK